MGSVFAVLAIAAMAAWNVNYGSQTKGMSDVMLANVEALAGCESTPKDDIGRSVDLNCTNSSGETYMLTACDFDSNYDDICWGRPAND